MANSFGILIFTMIFITVLGYFLNASGISEFTIISPTVFLVGQALMLLVIGLANTPVLKGVSLALWVGWLFAFVLNLDIPSPVGAYVYAIVLIPAFISITLLMLEVGKN